MFEAVWPIEDQDRTLAQLIGEARTTLPDLLFEAGAQQTGPVTWTVTNTDPPRLLATCPAEPWVDHHRPGRHAVRTLR